MQVERIMVGSLYRRGKKSRLLRRGQKKTPDCSDVYQWLAVAL